MPSTAPAVQPAILSYKALLTPLHEYGQSQRCSLIITTYGAEHVLAARTVSFTVSKGDMAEVRGEPEALDSPVTLAGEKSLIVGVTGTNLDLEDHTSSAVIENREIKFALEELSAGREVERFTTLKYRFRDRSGNENIDAHFKLRLVARLSPVRPTR